MKLIAAIIFTPVFVFTIIGVSVIGFAQPAHADICDAMGGLPAALLPGCSQGTGQPTSLFGGTNAIIPRVINLLLFIVGILAIIMLIYGGIRYVISGGNNERVKDAKNTILYAIVGLIVAILGYAIVNWVVANVGSGSNSGSSGSV